MMKIIVRIFGLIDMADFHLSHDNTTYTTIDNRPANLLLPARINFDSISWNFARINWLSLKSRLFFPFSCRLMPSHIHVVKENNIKSNWQLMVVSWMKKKYLFIYLILKMLFIYLFLKIYLFIQLFYLFTHL